MLELMQDPDELRFGVPAFVSEATSLEEMNERIARDDRHWADGAPGTLSIVATDDPSRFLGIMSWRFDVPKPFEIADIGYAVHPDERGRGVARAAIALMVDWLLYADSGPGLHRVQLDHSVENVASCRVALAAGLEREGVRRSYLPLRDPDAPGGERRHDVCLHGIVHS
jgi:RimJ/RimL family protein N-acetyltransferase